MQKKNTFFSIPAKETDPGCQTETVPEGGKIHRASSLFEIFIYFLAAHLPTPVPTRPSLPDPTSPHVKDYPGLGDPNTLKLVTGGLAPRISNAYKYGTKNASPLRVVDTASMYSNFEKCFKKDFDTFSEPENTF